jgi:hypothetical protein
MRMQSLNAIIWERSLIVLLCFVFQRVASVSAATYYVDASNLTPSFPYQTRASAAQHVEQVIPLAAEGDILLVDSGLYLLTKTLAITKSITIEGINGPDHTILRGNGSSRCVWLNASNATLSGFTIEQGHLPYGADGNGGGVYLQAGLLENCCIRSNSVFGNGCGVFQAGGLVRRCRIEDNQATSLYIQHIGYMDVYGAGIFIMNNSTSEECRIVRNRGFENCNGGGVALVNGTLLNSVVISNHAEDKGGNLQAWREGGGGVYLGPTSALINCTIAWNSATHEGGIFSIEDSAHTKLFQNCIIWGNSGASSSNYNEACTNFVWLNNCTYPPVNTGSGNISAAPNFDSSSPDPLVLKSHSPCIDAGTTNRLVPRDLAGILRPLDGNHDGIAQIDMGAFEYIDASSDSDSDGLSDDHEIRDWKSNPTRADTDADGMSDPDEVAAGTDLTNPGSFLMVHGFLSDPASLGMFSPAPILTLQWQGVSGREYEFLISTNFASPWIPLPDGPHFTGTNASMSCRRELPGPICGYTIRVRPSP